MAGGSFFNAELKLRIISAIILAALVISATWIGGYTFEILWAVVGFLVFFEFTRIVSNNISAAMRIVGALMLLIVLASWFSGDPITAYIMTAISISTLATWEGLFRRSFWTATALIYAILPVFAMSELRGEALSGLIAIAILFACVWGADVFAYVFGRLIGGPKLAPKISPKKTWAGFIGSLIGAVFLCYLVIWFANQPADIAFWILILALAIISQIGDLIISVIKRRFDVKDTGKIIPGHGGVLDRIDGLIPASVAFWGYLKYQTSDLSFGEQIGAALFSL